MGENWGASLLLAGLILIALSKRVQAGDKFICPTCGEIFNTQAELNAHIASAHPSAREQVIVNWG